MRSMKVCQNHDSTAVLFLDRDISNEARIMEIGDELNRIASNVPPGGELVLDFQNLAFFTTAMIGQLVQLRKAVQKNGAKLTLRNVSATIQDVFRVMRLEQVFHVES